MIAAVNSLAGRLLLASALLLPLFLGATGFYLDNSHRVGVEAAEAEQLKLQILTLLAEAEYDGALRLPEQLLEARFNRPDSGLYALITDNHDRVLWSSPSALTFKIESHAAGLAELEIGEESFARRGGFFQISYKVAWQTESGVEIPLTFSVLESVGPADAQLQIYRQDLRAWLGGSVLLLIVCQILILFWGLRPLRKLAEEITDIESGTTDTLNDAYPREVRALTRSLNSLLNSEKKRRERARNTLSDLAHSLKTPLAVIRNADAGERGYDQLVVEQTERMEQIVAYQLQRAVGGSHKLLRVVPIAPIVQRLRASLLKVYAGKSVIMETEIAEACVFRGDERDLLELLGILMDNACKYGRQHVRVTAIGGGTKPLLITVDDDGSGIPEQLRKAILQRGSRADSQQSGHGIGLAVATDLAESYLGSLLLTESILGGTQARVELP